MNIYGVELTSPDGKKFIIPDYNPFTFYAKFSVYGSGPSYTSVSTGVSVDTPCMFFINGTGEMGGGEGTAVYMAVVGGVWHLFGRGSATGPMTWTVYVFADRLLKDETQSAYGLQVFDGKGNMIMSNNSKPLKLEYYTPTWTPSAGVDLPWHNPIYPGKKIAVLPAITARYDPRNSNKTYFEISIGISHPSVGNFIGGMSYYHSSKFGPQGVVVRSYYPNILAIDCSLYD